LTKSPCGQRMRFSARRLVSFLLIVSIMVISTGNTLWQPTKAAVPSTLNINEWYVPTGNAGPAGINVDSTGRVWFGENLTGKLGMLDPAANNIYEWNLPSGTTQPSLNSRNIVAVGQYGIGLGSFRTYFAEYGKDRVSYLDTTAPTPAVTTTVTSTTTTITTTTSTSQTNRLTEWQIPSGAKPASIFIDDQGNMWFTESGRDAIGELNCGGAECQSASPAQFIEWTLPGANPGAGACAALCLWGIYVQKIPSTTDHYVWFTERTGGQTDAGEVGRLQLSNNVLTTWDLSTISNGLMYRPSDIAVDSAGNAYISNYFGNRISILGNSGTYREYAIGRANSKPLAVTRDPARNLSWFLEYTGNNLAYLNDTAPGNVLTLSASQCVIPSTITVTTSVTISRISFTTTTNTNPGLQSCDGNALQSGEVSMTATQTSIGPPNVSNQNPSIRPLGNAQGPVNGISEYAFPNSNSRPYSLTLDSNDNLWITESDNSANKIAEVILPTSPTSSTRSMTTSQNSVTTTATSTVTLSTTIYSINQSAVNPNSTYVQVSSNSTISALEFDSSRRLLNFTATGPPGTIGQTEVVIAASLIDGTPLVFVDNTPRLVLSLTVSSNSTHYTIIFTYPHSTHTITIVGSNTPIPEFPTPLPVLMIMLSFITVGAKIRRKLRISDSRTSRMISIVE
jgi:streptogramin lyase